MGSVRYLDGAFNKSSLYRFLFRGVTPLFLNEAGETAISPGYILKSLY